MSQKNQKQVLENIIRKVIREEIASAVPILIEYLKPDAGPSSQPMNENRIPMDKSQVRSMLSQHITYDDGSPVPYDRQPSYATNVQKQTIVPDAMPGHAGPRPLTGMTEEQQKVVSSFNKDYGPLMKKMGLKE